MKYAHLIFICSILMAFSCSTQKMKNDQLSKGEWAEIKTIDGSTPAARHEAAFIAVGDRYYLIGGRGMKPVSIYNTKTQQWNAGSIPPIEIHHFQPVVYQNEIYILGAMTGPYPGETPTTNIYIYNPTIDEWRMGDVIPEDRRRGGAGVSVHGDYIYMTCGIRDGHRGDHKKWLDVYHIPSGSWKKLADAPRPRDHFQTAIINNKLYAVAGRTTISSDNPFKNTMREVDIYDIDTDIWSTAESQLPTPRAGNAVITIGNELLVFGGESFYQQSSHPELESYDTVTGKWRTLTEIPVGRHGTGLILDGQRLITASGSGDRGGGPELDDLWVFEF